MGRRGFSLIEFLLAIMFFLVASAAALYINVIGLRAAKATHLRLLITKGVIEQQIEYLRSQSFGALAAGLNQPITSATCPMLDTTVFVPPFTTAGPEAQRAIMTAVYDVVAVQPTLKRVTIRVTWTDPFSRQETRSASTLISQGGLTNP